MSDQPNPAQVYEDFLVAHMFRPFARDLVARAAPQAGERALDVGTGTGVVARLVAPLVGATGSVTGLDPSAPMLAVARERSGAEGFAIAWREGDATALPFADGSFDLVVCQQVVQFVPDKQAAAREMRRVLTPGGRAIISAWSPLPTSPIEEALDRIVMERFGISPMAAPFGMGGPENLEALLRGAGFTEVAVESAGLTLRMPAYAEYVRRVVPGAMAVVPSLASLSAEERRSLMRAIEEELRPRIAEYLDGEALNFPKRTDIAIARG